MRIIIDIPGNKIEDIISDIKNIENVSEVIIEGKKGVDRNILERKPNNQIDILEIVISIVLTKISEEAVNFSKAKILQLFRDKKVKVKNVEEKSK